MTYQRCGLWSKGLREGGKLDYGVNQDTAIRCENISK